MIAAYSTQRLEVVELTSTTTAKQLDAFARALSNILSPDVVSYLPPFFARATTSDAARALLDKMLAQSRVYCICSRETGALMGLVFASMHAKHQTNIGYLLAQQYWGQGIATELMTAFVSEYAPLQQWRELVAGVAKDNKASIKLLLNLGFTLQEAAQAHTQRDTQATELFYIYNVQRQ